VFKESIEDVIKFKKDAVRTWGLFSYATGLFNLEGNLSCGRKIDLCKNRRKKEKLLTVNA